MQHPSILLQGTLVNTGWELLACHIRPQCDYAEQTADHTWNTCCIFFYSCSNFLLLCFSSQLPVSRPLLHLHLSLHFPVTGPGLPSTPAHTFSSFSSSFLSRIQLPVPVPGPLTGVPWVSSSNRCFPVYSPSCSSGCAASPTHGPEPLWGSDADRGMKWFIKVIWADPLWTRQSANQLISCSGGTYKYLYVHACVCVVPSYSV